MWTRNENGYASTQKLGYNIDVINRVVFNELCKSLRYLGSGILREERILRMEEYNVTTYPEGYQMVISRELNFLPEDQREDFMFSLLCFMISC